jgi:hypothetical protein
MVLDIGGPILFVGMQNCCAPSWQDRATTTTSYTFKANRDSTLLGVILED